MPSLVNGSTTASASTTSSTVAVPNPLKVMVVGDSISQGQDGDHTWRYRIWQWFRDSAPGISVAFIGPYTGTWPSDPPQPPQPPVIASDPVIDNSGPRTFGRYAADVSADFDSNHFAASGRAVAQVKDVIRQQVETYQPDMLLVLLGFNDMGWWISDAQGTLDSMQTFIKEAREAKPDIFFAVSDVPHRSFIGGRQDLVDNTTAYNNKLPDALDALRSDTSPIEHVDLAAIYSCGPDGCPAGYDGLHPNARGEYEIARAFSLTLHNRYGIGRGPLDIPSPIPKRPVPIPNNIVATGAPMGVTVTWDAVLGARGYEVRHRTQGAADWSVSTAQANRFDTTFTIANITWEYQIRTSGGNDEKGDWSAVVSAASRRDTAPAPSQIQTFSEGSGLKVSWTPPDGDWDIDRYEVIILDQDTPGAFINSQGCRGTEAEFTGLTVGHRYSVHVGTWAIIDGQSAGGLPGSASPVVVGFTGPVGSSPLPEAADEHATMVTHE